MNVDEPQLEGADSSVKPPPDSLEDVSESWDAERLTDWVRKRPLLLIRFDDRYSEALSNTKSGFERISLTKPHSVFDKAKLPTLCVLETNDFRTTRCYLGTVTRKSAVSTFESRITIGKLRAIIPASLTELENSVSETQLKGILSRRLPEDGELQVLSPKLSAHLIDLLATFPENRAALDTAVSMLPGMRQLSDSSWAQEDAIQTALAAFGIRNSDSPESVSLKVGCSSGLGLLGAHLYEDNVVRADASRIAGFDAITPDVTGRAEFRKGEEKLVIYTANKLPLETTFGVDLIYVNETRGSIVMVQYKMLEPHDVHNAPTDWRFRPDKQLHAEIARMQLPEIQGNVAGYRLHRSPYFFKFVKRKVVDDSSQSFIISLEHFNQILNDPAGAGALGTRDGIRVSFNALNGTYLREKDIIGLIRSGYIGTYRTETQYLQTIIKEIAEGNKAVVLAWQSRFAEQTGEDLELAEIASKTPEGSEERK